MYKFFRAYENFLVKFQKMSQPSLRARYTMEYKFKRNKHPQYALKKINENLNDDEKIDLRTCQHWFRRFRMGIFCMDIDFE